jgi:putative sterol carrier protein
VPEWLSEGWLKEVAAMASGRPAVAGANGTVSVAVTGGPSKEVSYHWSYRDGVPGDGGIGAAPDADLALTIPYADARDIAAGEVEPSVAYMRGRLKSTGDDGLLIGLLASTATAGYREWHRRVAAEG